MAFNLFPYTNLHNLNLDWILATLKAMVATIEQAQSTISSYESRLEAAETGLAQITPAAQGAVRHDVSQALDTENRRRAAGNIHAVSFDTQLLSAAEQAQARTNIGAISSGDIPPAADAVLYTAQQLTEPQQVQARANIEAASQSDMTTVQGGLQRTVRWDVQQLTAVQKQQARNNIGAISAGDIPPAAAAPYILIVSEDETGTAYEVTTGTVAGAAAALDNDRLVLIQFIGPDNVVAPARLIYTGSTLTGLQAEVVTHAETSSPMPNVIYKISIVDVAGAGSVTVTEIQQRQVPVPDLLTDAGKVLAVNRLGRPVWEDRINKVTDTISTTPTITNAADNTIYEFTQELTSLSLVAGSGAYSIVFTSGATPTTTSFPATILGLETFAAEANTIYEINVMDNRAVVGSWEVST